MSSATPERLSSFVGRMLEDAAFIFAEPPEIAPPPFSGTVIEAWLSFSGREEGELWIAADEQLAAELAANLLGEDAGDPTVAARGAEALGELANVLAGSLVVELYGDEVPCRLGVPAIRTLSPADYRRKAPGEACSVVLVTEEGRRFDAALRTAARGG